MSSTQNLLSSVLRAVLVLALFIALMAIVSSTAAAQDVDDPLSWDRHIQGHFQRYCYRCHRDEAVSGDVDLQRDTDVRQILEHRETWMMVRDQIASGTMPPEDERQPSPEERQLMLDFLAKTLDALDCESTERDPGAPVLRRLNHAEYDLAVFDLTGLDLQLGESFPPEAEAYGFDNVGDVLGLSNVQLENYHAAAVSIVAAMLERAEREPEYAARYFGETAEIANDDRESHEQLAAERLRDFASGAFRRPVDESLLQRLLEVYRRGRSESLSHSVALSHGMVGVLISPRFLLRLEASRLDQEGAYPVDAYELATRLSFFLWSRPPDAELLERAADQTLLTDEVLAAQVQRMLADERAGVFIERFFGQWLGLKAIETHQPNAEVFPEFDAALRESMQEEIRLVLLEMVQQDRSIETLMDSDFTYVDQRLAQHYGFEGVALEGWQRVELEDRRRGGLLTTAGWLMVQSDPSRTNIPRRGNFIAATILGTAPPPPPPNVPQLDAVPEADRPLTVRERLDRHRTDPTCANCHAKIDPLGYALENYDAIGRWRETEFEQPIDASGTMPDGTSWQNVLEWKAIMLERKGALRREFAEKLLIYALGRGLSGTDECTIRNIEQAALNNEDRFSSYIRAIVQSPAFRMRRNDR